MYLIKRSNGVYYIELKLQNKTHRISTSKRTKREAIYFLNNFDPLSFHEKDRSAVKILLSEFKEKYLAYAKVIRSKKYCTSIESCFKFLIDGIGDIELSKVTPQKLQRILFDKYESAKYAAWHNYRTLRAAFNVAVEWAYIPTNPFSKIKLPRVPKKIPIFISVEQLGIILSFVSTKVYSDIIEFAFYTGMRLNEILNLEWKDVDMLNKMIFVKISQSFITKNRTERVIPMHSKVFNILTEIKKDNVFNYVFCKANGAKLLGETISDNFKNSVRKSDLDPRIHFHSLRHSFASNLVQKGVSLYIVKELLGHEDFTTTQVYSHLEPRKLNKEVELL